MNSTRVLSAQNIFWTGELYCECKNRVFCTCNEMNQFLEVEAFSTAPFHCTQDFDPFFMLEDFPYRKNDRLKSLPQRAAISTNYKIRSFLFTWAECETAEVSMEYGKRLIQLESRDDIKYSDPNWESKIAYYTFPLDEPTTRPDFLCETHIRKMRKINQDDNIEFKETKSDLFRTPLDKLSVQQGCFSIENFKKEQKQIKDDDIMPQMFGLEFLKTPLNTLSVQQGPSFTENIVEKQKQNKDDEITPQMFGLDFLKSSSSASSVQQGAPSIENTTKNQKQNKYDNISPQMFGFGHSVQFEENVLNAFNDIADKVSNPQVVVKTDDRVHETLNQILDKLSNSQVNLNVNEETLETLAEASTSLANGNIKFGLDDSTQSSIDRLADSLGNHNINLGTTDNLRSVLETLSERFQKIEVDVGARTKHTFTNGINKLCQFIDSAKQVGSNCSKQVVSLGVLLGGIALGILLVYVIERYSSKYTNILGNILAVVFSTALFGHWIVRSIPLIQEIFEVVRRLARNTATSLKDVYSKIFTFRNGEGVNEIIEEIQPQIDLNESSIHALMSCLYSFFHVHIYNKLPQASKSMHFLRMVGDFSKQKTGLKDLTQTLIDAFNSVVTYCQDKLGIKISRVEKDNKQIQDIIDEISVLSGLPVCEESAVRLNQVVYQCKNLRETFKGNAEMQGVINSAMSSLLKIKSKFEQANFFSTKSKPNPLCIMFAGPSGVGKSTCVIPFAQELIARTLPADQLENFKKNKNNFLFSRAPENEYWEGYCGQHAVIFDDFGQAKDVAGSPDNEYMNLIRAANIFEYPLHMADIGSKASTYFISELIVATSNLETIKPNSIVQPEAVSRRFNFYVYVVPKPAYCKVGANNAVPTNIWDRRLDTTKIRPILSEDQPMSFEVYDFFLADTNETCTEGSREYYKIIDPENPLTYDALMQRCVQKQAAMKQEFTNYTTMLDKRVDDIILNRLQPQINLAEQLELLEIIRTTPGQTTMNTFTEFRNKFSAEDLLKLQRLCTNMPLYSVYSVLSDVMNDMNLEELETLLTGIRNNYLPFFKAIKKHKISVEYSGILGKFRLLKDTILEKISKFINFDKIFKFIIFGLCCLSAGGVLSLIKDGMSFFSAYRNHDEDKCEMNMEQYQSFNDQDFWPEDSGVARNMRKLNAAYAEDSGDARMVRRPNTAYAESQVNVNKTKKPTKLNDIFGTNLHYWEDIRRNEDHHFIPGTNLFNPCANFSGPEHSVSRYHHTCSKCKRDVVKISRFYNYQCASCLGFEVPDWYFYNKEAFEKANDNTNKPQVEVHDEIAAQILQEEMRDYENQDIFPEGGCDLTACSILDKIKNRSMYSLTLPTFKKRSGFILFVRGTIFIMPQHFALSVKTLLENGTFSPDDLCTLRSCGTDKLLKIPLIELSNGNNKVHSFEGMDLVVGKASQNVPNHPDIVKLFVKRDQLNVKQEWYGCLTVFNNDREIRHAVKCTSLDRQYNYSVLDNPVNLRHGYEYRANTVDGDCGSLLTLFDSTIANKLLGIHVAGNSRGIAFSTSVTCDLLNDVIDKYFPEEIYSQMDFSNKTPMSILKTEFVSLRKVKNGIRSPTKTKVLPTILYGAMGPSKYAPAVLNDFYDEKQDKWIDPLTKALSNYANHVSYYNQTIIDACANSYCSDLIRATSHIKNRELFDFENSVRGIPGYDFCTGIPRNTSSGWPHCVNNKVSNKKIFFGSDGDYQFDSAECKILKLDVLDTIEKAKQGMRKEHVFMDQLKDERRTLEKVEIGKTRAFSACPLDLTVPTRMYFLSFSVAMMEAQLENGMALGLNVYSDNWDALARKMQSKGNCVIAGDFKFWDSSQTPQIHRCLLQIINKWYGDSRENQRVREVLYEDLYNSIHICNDTIYEWSHSLPSGHPLTTIVNCMYNNIVFRYCWVRAHNNDITSLRDFTRLVYFVSYGDDNMANIDGSKIDIFNQNTIANFMPELGLTYTDETKSGESPDYRQLSEISFLKRTFRFEEEVGRFVAPLAWETIHEMPYWTKKGPMELETVHDNVEAALREASLHGRDIFNIHFLLVSQVYRAECGRIPLNSSFEFYLNWALNTVSVH